MITAVINKSWKNNRNTCFTLLALCNIKHFLNIFLNNISVQLKYMCVNTTHVKNVIKYKRMYIPELKVPQLTSTLLGLYPVAYLGL